MEQKLAKKKKKSNMIMLEAFDDSASEEELAEEDLQVDDIPNNLTTFQDAVKQLLKELSFKSDVECAKLISLYGLKGNYSLNIHPKRVMDSTNIDFKPFSSLGEMKTTIILDKSATALNGKKGTQRLLRFPLSTLGSQLQSMLNILKKIGITIPQGLLSSPETTEFPETTEVDTTHITEDSLYLHMTDSLVTLELSRQSLGKYYFKDQLITLICGYVNNQFLYLGIADEWIDTAAQAITVLDSDSDLPGPSAHSCAICNQRYEYQMELVQHYESFHPESQAPSLRLVFANLRSVFM